MAQWPGIAVHHSVTRTTPDGSTYNKGWTLMVPSPGESEAGRTNRGRCGEGGESHTYRRAQAGGHDSNGKSGSEPVTLAAERVAAERAVVLV